MAAQDELRGPVRYSVVVPAYKEEKSLPALADQLRWLMDRLDGPCEVIFVDDGSPDATFEVASKIQDEDPRFEVVQLSRNFGHQVALTAGLYRARGQAVITMDGDLQHPVEAVLEMVQRWKEGYDIAYGVMIDRPSESAFKRWTSDGFYRFFNRFSDTPTPSNAGDFRLLDRQVVDAFLTMPERNRYIRGMFAWLGFRQVAVPYECAPRHAGHSSYTLRRMLRFATDALLSFSTWPLRVGLAFGFAVSAFSILFGLATIVIKLTSHTVPGWTTIVVVVSFIGGAQLTLLGVIGEYIGRMYDEVKGRPMFVVRQSPTNRGEPDLWPPVHPDSAVFDAEGSAGSVRDGATGARGRR